MTTKSTPHLDRTEFVDFLDGTLPAARRQHVHGCDACRRSAEELSRVAEIAGSDNVPEPSPLFWDQLSDRVRLAIANEPRPAGTLWQFSTISRIPLAAAAAAVVILMSVIVWHGVGPAPQRDGNSASAADSGALDDIAAEDAADEIESDAAWALVRAVAEDVAADDMDGEGVSSQPGSAYQVALRLTARERIELARLLEEHMKTSAKTESAS